MTKNNTIAAISTGNSGAISIIRVSGEDAIKISDRIFLSKNQKKLSSSKGFTLHYGEIVNDKKNIIDDVIVSVFHEPNSYTGENMIEISCHGSQYIQQEILSLLIHNGASIASAGEFTMRAYLNKKMDLVQAEAVADMISCQNESSHRMAINQMRGGYSLEFSKLREELLHLMSLLELELDFSDEDVEFADRVKLTSLLNKTADRINSLTSSFKQGNAIKNGVPIAIVGKPNTGKSTLLNALLNEQRALVSDIAGTTRDIIEECINISGIKFRFIDTAGIHQTNDLLENMGIEKTLSTISKADLIFLVITPDQNIEQINSQIEKLSLQKWQQLLIIINKIDTAENKTIEELTSKITQKEHLEISAKKEFGIDNIKNYLSNNYTQKCDDIVISNTRHLELLLLANNSLTRALEGIKNQIPSDFIAQDLRETIHHIGSITGEISSDNILHNIFANFCIGK